jgi:transcriptional regulator with GAF, ATPase, and Fis domain
MLPGADAGTDRQRERRFEELDLLHRISELVQTVHTSRERFLQVMALLDETLGKRYGTLTIQSPMKGKPVLQVAFGDPTAQGCIQGLDPAITQEVLARGRPVVLHPSDRESFPALSGSLPDENATLLCIPIMKEAQPVGVLSTVPIYLDAPSFERDLRLLKIIACLAFQDAPLPEDHPMEAKESTADPPLDRILDVKLKRMVEKVDPRTESQCALLPDIIRLVEKIVIKWALARHQNVQTTTAQFLGINRNTLRKKMKEHNIHSNRA